MAGKYKAQPITVNGVRYDSKGEYQRWEVLVLLQKAGRISDLQRQVTFELIPEQRNGGKREAPVVYRADFVYTQDGKRVVEDYKGYRTEAYRIKRKLMLYLHGVSIKETGRGDV